MNITLLIILFAFFLWIFRNTLFWVGLWQDKEYRLDRLLVHFRETEQGKKIFLSVGNIIKWLLLVLISLSLFFPGNDQYFIIFSLIIDIVFIIQAIFLLKDAFFHKIKRPIFTLKVMLIIILAVISIIYIFMYTPPIFSLLILDRLLPFIVAGLVGILAIPSWIYKKYIVNKAKRKLKNFPKLKAIAVSGSYGKTSTKEYIAQVLSKKFKVVKTPGSNNTPIGIAKTILSNIKYDTEVFVVEMGAYKIGEIKELCQIVRPSISVTTAISDQHMSLYGSIENVINSEYELISAMDSNSISFFNADSKYMEELFKRTKHKKIYFSTDKREVIANLDGVSFEVLFDKYNFSFKAPVLGIHAVQNILPSIYIAELLGMKIVDIKDAVAHLTPTPKTMCKVILKNDAIGIDDTFNASPESVFAALEYLSLGKKKKYFVFAPLSELGKNAPSRHKEIGNKLGLICDKVFILNKNFSGEIVRGIKESGAKCEVLFGSVGEILDSLLKTLSKDDLVIFEGKEAGMILKKLL